MGGCPSAYYRCLHHSAAPFRSGLQATHVQLSSDTLYSTSWKCAVVFFLVVFLPPFHATTIIVPLLQTLEELWDILFLFQLFRLSSGGSSTHNNGSTQGWTAVKRRLRSKLRCTRHNPHILLLLLLLYAASALLKTGAVNEPKRSCIAANGIDHCCHDDHSEQESGMA